MVPNWWPESSNFEIKHGLPLHGSTPSPDMAAWVRKSYFAVWDNPCRSPYMGRFAKIIPTSNPWPLRGPWTGEQNLFVPESNCSDIQISKSPHVKMSRCPEAIYHGHSHKGWAGAQVGIGMCWGAGVPLSENKKRISNACVPWIKY